MNQVVPEPEVFIDTQGALGIITLNRPEVLNALSLEMIREVAAALHRWKDDPSISAVFFKGAGERAFCSGGDIKSFYKAGMDSRRGLASHRVPVVYFAEEYSLNKQIFDYPKPTIAFMDGFTMGGGYGLAGHCSVRIATSKTVWAMPETGIGFFPDVGSMFYLQRCPFQYGRYLALTGSMFDGRETAAAGLADFFVGGVTEKEAMKAAVNAAEAGDVSAAIMETLGGECVAPAELTHSDAVERIFCDCDLAAIFERLEAEDSDFSREALALLQSRSPISFKVTAAYLEKSADFTFDQVINMDFVLVQHFIKGVDMYEGIRAQLIDKDKTPIWSPAEFKNVLDQDVNNYFTPTGYDLSDVQIF